MKGHLIGFMNTEFHDLLAKHLNGTLNEEEKGMLAVLLRAPENQLYLATQIDEQFFDELLKEASDDETGNHLFQCIRQQIGKEGAPDVLMEDSRESAKVIPITWYKRKAIRWMAAAAAVILLVLSFGVLLNSNTVKEPSVAVQKRTAATEGSLAVLRHEVNTTGREKKIQLADGSVIVLANNTEVSFMEPFASIREIRLKGKAFFKVAKDPARPFTVISGDISTTALGTEFTVTAFKNTSRVIVRLYEGKVVVKAVENNKILKNKVYLLPGQEYVYSREAKGKVATFKVDNTIEPERILNAELAKDNPSVPEEQGSWYMFNNESLAQVFDQLAEMYNTEIDYNKTDLQNIYFIGKFDKSDSLEQILKRIGTLNNLTIRKTGEKFVISK